MSSYKALLEQRKLLEQQIETTRKVELSGAIEQARSLVSEYQLTPEDVFPSPAKRGSKGGAKPGTKVAPKYKDPNSELTWTGRGRAPKWIADTPEDQRHVFLIQQ